MLDNSLMTECGERSMNNNETIVKNKYKNALKAAKDAVDKIDESYIHHLMALKAVDQAAYDKARALLKPDLLHKLDRKMNGDGYKV